jgi:hypothetical protein
MSRITEEQGTHNPGLASILQVVRSSDETPDSSIGDKQSIDAIAGPKSGIGTILVSPHPDDVAFSVGGTILTSFFPRPLLIATPFTRSIYAPRRAAGRDVDTISHLRETEDLAFARSTGSRYVRWNLPTSALSSDMRSGTFPLICLSTLFLGWPSPRGPLELGLERISSTTPSRIRHLILQRAARLDNRYIGFKTAISRLHSVFPDSILVSPLGIGNHLDHLIATWACRSLRHRVQKMYFYEDLPYASEYDTKGIVRHVRLIDRNLHPVTVDIGRVMGAKIKNLSLYSTQVSSDDVDRVVGHARKVGQGALSERLWKY